MYQEQKKILMRNVKDGAALQIFKLRGSPENFLSKKPEVPQKLLLSSGTLQDRYNSGLDEHFNFQIIHKRSEIVNGTGDDQWLFTTEL